MNDNVKRIGGVLVSIYIFVVLACVNPGSAESEKDLYTQENLVHDSIPEHPINHTLFTDLLQEYVNDEGLVNYRGFAEAQDELEKYLTVLSKNPPTLEWSREERLAYWINAYNAFTIELILNHYPVESIKEIKSDNPAVKTPWDIKFIHIGDKTYCLDDIENKILREKFNEPRIHFAIVCASNSCPPLSNQAYTADKLDVQLDQAGAKFIKGSKWNELVNGDTAYVSKIFKWYAGDFISSQGDSGDLYKPLGIDSTTKIIFKDYDWGLNAQKEQ